MTNCIDVKKKQTASANVQVNPNPTNWGPFGPHAHRLLTTAMPLPFTTRRFVTLFSGLFYVIQDTFMLKITNLIFV